MEKGTSWAEVMLNSEKSSLWPMPLLSYASLKAVSQLGNQAVSQAVH